MNTTCPIIEPANTAPAPRLLDAVRGRIRAKYYSRRTEEAYVYWIRQFIKFHHKRHPREMGAPEVEAFLNYLAAMQLPSAVRNELAQVVEDFMAL